MSWVLLAAAGCCRLLERVLQTALEMTKEAEQQINTMN